MSEAAKITASDIRAAMLKRWTAQEYAIMWEVAPATGSMSGKVRYADAVMMSLWPSRGLELHGVEIKVSRSDWMREAKDPTKAERIGAYCDRWWVHVAPNVIHDLCEVPPAWGVRVWDGKAWKTLREAGKTDAKDVDRGFLAALLRRSDEVQREIARRELRERQDAANKAIDDQRDQIEKRVESLVAQRTQRFEKLSASVVAFEEASGLSLATGWNGIEDAKEIGALVKAIRVSGIHSVYGGLKSLVARLRDSAGKLVEELIATGLPFADPPDVDALRKKLVV